MLFQTIFLALSLEFGGMPVDQMYVSGSHNIDVQYYSKPQQKHFIKTEKNFKNTNYDFSNSGYFSIQPELEYKGFSINGEFTPRVTYQNSLEFVDFNSFVECGYTWNKYTIGSSFDYTVAPDDEESSLLFPRMNQTQWKLFVRITFSTDME